MSLEKGIKFNISKIVNDTDTAAAFGSGALRVFSTPSMIALMEQCAHISVKQFLAETEDTVGIELNIKHLRAVNVGSTVNAVSELIDIDGKILTFSVSVIDNNGIIGEGLHKRAIINVEKFLSKLT